MTIIRKINGKYFAYDSIRIGKSPKKVKSIYRGRFYSEKDIAKILNKYRKELLKLANKKIYRVEE